jgi:hypothetical protein
MALMEEDPKDVALALLLGWDRVSVRYPRSQWPQLPQVWWRPCSHIEFSLEPTVFKGTNRNLLCLVQPTAACCVARDTR